jgi:hypothetical protein
VLCGGAGDICDARRWKEGADHQDLHPGCLAIQCETGIEEARVGTGETAHRMEKAVLAATNPPELTLLRRRLETRPSLTMGSLAQKTGPTELVLGKDIQTNGLW